MIIQFGKYLDQRNVENEILAAFAEKQITAMEAIQQLEDIVGHEPPVALALLRAWQEFIAERGEHGPN
jgi:hypothetical protein